MEINVSKLIFRFIYTQVIIDIKIEGGKTL